MRQAVFITGFSNWGKTRIINSLFNKSRFNFGWTYQIEDVNFSTKFTVETHSNDDYWGEEWLKKLKYRIEKSKDDGQNLFTALCPTMQDNNNYVELLNNPLLVNYIKHIFLIEYKFEHHAKLVIESIKLAGKALPNVNFKVINKDQDSLVDNERQEAKLKQIREELNNIFMP